MTKTEEIEILKGKIRELENRPLELLNKRMVKDIEFLGQMLVATCNDYFIQKVYEVYEKWGIEK